MNNFIYKLKIFFLRLISYEKPYRVAIVKYLSLKFKTFRPHYETILYESAREASKLGYKELSVLELGVSGGNGIIALENYKKNIENAFNMKISVFGFDTGTGMPNSNLKEDALFNWKQGDYKVNKENLKRKVTSKIYYGLADKTIEDFIKDNPPHVCAIFFDMDYYSSTYNFLNNISKIKNLLIPRVLCYFDDIFTPNNYMGKYLGELKAIRDFNKKEINIKLMNSIDHISDYKFPLAKGSLYTLHSFEHELYNKFIGEDFPSSTDIGDKKSPNLL